MVCDTTTVEALGDSDSEESGGISRNAVLAAGSLGAGILGYYATKGDGD